MEWVALWLGLWWWIARRRLRKLEEKNERPWPVYTLDELGVEHDERDR